MPSFDILKSRDLFYIILKSFERYKMDNQKRHETLLFIIFSLNHLREWIAPERSRNKDLDYDAIKFYNDIFLIEEFKIINNLCNGIKHFESRPQKNSGKILKTRAEFNRNFIEWDDVRAVKDVYKGAPKDFLVDDRNITEIIEPVIEFYRKNWFEKDQGSYK